MQMLQPLPLMDFCRRREVRQVDVQIHRQLYRHFQLMAHLIEGALMALLVSQVLKRLELSLYHEVHPAAFRIRLG